jgi:hypothetical protein
VLLLLLLQPCYELHSGDVNDKLFLSLSIQPMPVSGSSNNTVLTFVITFANPEDGGRRLHVILWMHFGDSRNDAHLHMAAAAGEKTIEIARPFGYQFYQPFLRPKIVCPWFLKSNYFIKENYFHAMPITEREGRAQWRELEKQLSINQLDN